MGSVVYSGNYEQVKTSVDYDIAAIDVLIDGTGSIQS